MIDKNCTKQFSYCDIISYYIKEIFYYISPFIIKYIKTKEFELYILLFNITIIYTIYLKYRRIKNKYDKLLIKYNDIINATT